jgi:hypothetical protein
MNFTYKTKPSYAWREWFAWYPVKTTTEDLGKLSLADEPDHEYTVTWHWLEKVYRRRHTRGGKERWTYCTIFDLIKLQEEQLAYSNTAFIDQSAMKPPSNFLVNKARTLVPSKLVQKG